MSNRLIGDKYIKAICVGLLGSKFMNVKSLNFSNNNLKKEGLEHVIENLSENISNLNLSENPLGWEGSQLLRTLCENAFTKYSLNSDLKCKELEPRGYASEG